MSNNSTSGARGALNPAVILNDIFTAWRLLWNPRVPFGLKLALPILAAVYWVFPFDLMPGLPFDDIAILIVAVKLFLQFAQGAAESGDTNNRATGTNQGTSNRPGDDDAIDTTWRVVNDD